MKTQAFNPFLPSYEYIPDKEGIIYRTVQDPMNEDGSQHLFAPDVQMG